MYMPSHYDTTESTTTASNICLVYRPRVGCFVYVPLIKLAVIAVIEVWSVVASTVVMNDVRALIQVRLSDNTIQ